MFYIRTGDRLQRTARWLESLEGGMKYLRQVILEDKLGICADLEKQMSELVGTWYDEWEVALKDPVKRAQFKQFKNTEERSEQIELVKDRGQTRPANWPKESVTEDFRGYKWTSMDWEKVCKVDDLRHSAAGGSCAIKRGDTQLAIFYVEGKGYYATQQMCPHKRAFVLSDGIIGDDPGSPSPFVSCPMHKRNYSLTADKDAGGGKCLNDEAVSIATFPIEARGDEIWLKLPPEDELDSVLGTSRWRVKKSEVPDKLASLDKFTAKTKIKFANVTEGGCGDNKLDW
jgi:nitrite reductase (NAD(P)H)